MQFFIFLFFAVCACMQNFAIVVSPFVSVKACPCQESGRRYMHLDTWARSCVHHTFMHAPRNIISRNIISHIAVMTLGRYVDYTVGKQQPADWVSILPYITSLHSSLCVCFFCFFLLPSFFQITSHFPSFLGEVPGYASRWCEVIWW